MHNIYAPTRIRAASYAASLGLADAAWRAISTPGAAMAGILGHSHILPGVSDDLRRTALRNASKQTTTTLVDLSAVA